MTRTTDARVATVLTLLVACGVLTVFKRAILVLLGFSRTPAWQPNLGWATIANQNNVTGRWRRTWSDAHYRRQIFGGFDTIGCLQRPDFIQKGHFAFTWFYPTLGPALVLPGRYLAGYGLRLR